jgi:hypothetical protein
VGQCRHRAPPVVPPGVTMPKSQREERIRKRAQEIYAHRSAAGEAGDALSDWLQAEEEVEAEEQRDWLRSNGDDEE